MFRVAPSFPSYSPQLGYRVLSDRDQVVLIPSNSSIVIDFSDPSSILYATLTEFVPFEFFHRVSLRFLSRKVSDQVNASI